MSKKGILIVVSGPSGCGKGTILGKLFESCENLEYSVSATTRAPRNGEVDGVNYHFKTKEEFISMAENGELLEYACYCDNYYGTPKKQVLDMLESGKDVILEIEVEGAMQIKETYPNAAFVFILPPSVKVLKERLTGRGTESPEVVESRIKKALSELTMAYKYDYAIINDKLDEAVEALRCVINGEKQVVGRMINKIDEVLENA